MHKNLQEARKKKIFPDICGYLRSLNPYPGRNFSDVYVEYFRDKVNNNIRFDNPRLSRWIHGNKSDPLNNPDYIDIIINFVTETFQSKNIDAAKIATRIRNKYQAHKDPFYDFIETHEELYLKKKYIPYLEALIRDENSNYSMAIKSEPEREYVLESDPNSPSVKRKPLLGRFTRKIIFTALGAALALGCGIVLIRSRSQVKTNVDGKISFIYQSFDATGDSWSWDNGEVVRTFENTLNGSKVARLTAPNGYGGFGIQSENGSWDVDLVPDNNEEFKVLSFWTLAYPINHARNTVCMQFFDQEIHKKEPVIYWSTIEALYGKWTRIVISLSEVRKESPDIDFHHIDKLEIQEYHPGTYYFEDLFVMDYRQ